MRDWPACRVVSASFHLARLGWPRVSSRWHASQSVRWAATADVPVATYTSSAVARGRHTRELHASRYIAAYSPKLRRWQWPSIPVKRASSRTRRSRRCAGKLVSVTGTSAPATGTCSPAPPPISSTASALSGFMRQRDTWSA